MPSITRDQVRVPADVPADMRDVYIDNYLKATRNTGAVCPFKVCNNIPSETRHRRIVLSSEPEARIVPSGLNAALATMPPLWRRAGPRALVIGSQS